MEIVEPKPAGKKSSGKNNFTPEEMAKIEQHAIVLFDRLANGELKGYDLEHVATVAFYRAKSFVAVAKRLAERGEIPEVESRSVSHVTAPNLERNKMNLRWQQRAVLQYIQEGEPGPERLLEINKLHQSAN